MLLFGIAVAIIVILFYYINSTKDIYISDEQDFFSDMEEKDVVDEEETENTIIVHVTGAVMNEGIAEVKENARINDVIIAAGGLTEDANLDNVNLAYQVEDGQKIYIPSNSEVIKDTDNAEKSASGVSDNVIKSESADAEEGIININTASQEKLQELPGIGSQTALKIVTYRKENR